MHLSDLTNLIYPLLLVIGGVVGYVIFRSNYAKADNQLKEDLITTRGQKIEDLQSDIDSLKKRDDDQQKMIDSLTGELKSWRDQPIKQLSEDYHELSEAVTEIAKYINMVKSEGKKSGTTSPRRK